MKTGFNSKKFETYSYEEFSKICTVVSIIGAGAYGVTFQSKLISTGEDVCVKACLLSGVHSNCLKYQKIRVLLEYFHFLGSLRRYRVPAEIVKVFSFLDVDIPQIGTENVLFEKWSIVLEAADSSFKRSRFLREINRGLGYVEITKELLFVLVIVVGSHQRDQYSANENGIRELEKVRKIQTAIQTAAQEVKADGEKENGCVVKGLVNDFGLLVPLQSFLMHFPVNFPSEFVEEFEPVAFPYEYMPNDHHQDELFSGDEDDSDDEVQNAFSDGEPDKPFPKHSAFQATSPLAFTIQITPLYPGTLQQFLERYRLKLSEFERLYILYQLLSSISFLHTRVEVTHNDIRTDNILYAHGSTKISDFGMPSEKLVKVKMLRDVQDVGDKIVKKGDAWFISEYLKKNDIRKACMIYVGMKYSQSQDTRYPPWVLQMLKLTDSVKGGVNTLREKVMGLVEGELMKVKFRTPCFGPFFVPKLLYEMEIRRLNMELVQAKRGNKDEGDSDSDDEKVDAEK